MRLLILFISFLISQVADSQIISASPPYRVRASGCATKLLDAYSGAAAAYSLRKLDADYAGSAIRVRRSSDNTEQDIGFVGCGDLDTAALKTFVGTGGSDSGYVTTWYSQVGSSNVSQATAAAQPLIIINGVVQRVGVNPAVYFKNYAPNSPRNLKVASFLAGSAATNYVVAKADADPSTCNNCGSPVEYTAQALSSHIPYSDGTVYDGWASSTRYNTGNPSTSLASPFLYCAISSASDWKNYINNSLNYSAGSNSYSVGATFYIGSGNGTWGFAGFIQEVIVYGDASSDGNRNGISGNINTYYTIY